MIKRDIDSQRENYRRASSALERQRTDYGRLLEQGYNDAEADAVLQKGMYGAVNSKLDDLVTANSPPAVVQKAKILAAQNNKASIDQDSKLRTEAANRAHLGAATQEVYSKIAADKLAAQAKSGGTRPYSPEENKAMADESARIGQLDQLKAIAKGGGDQRQYDAALQSALVGLPEPQLKQLTDSLGNGLTRSTATTVKAIEAAQTSAKLKANAIAKQAGRPVPFPDQEMTAAQRATLGQ
jgi:hypothetical protein